MIKFDSLVLKNFCIENAAFFEGAKIQKIQQPSKYELLFQIRAKGETRKLYINFHACFYHICFITEETSRLRNINMPKAAPMFCMLLRKYIQNTKIIRIAVPEYERIFEIYFEYYDEFNEKSELCLSAELMGKYSNVILYNYDNNVIIGCAHNVGSEKSRERELRGTLPYIYPVKQNKKDLLKTDFETFKASAGQTLKQVQGDIYCHAELVSASVPIKMLQTVSQNFYYLTAVLVQDIIETIKPFDLKTLYEKLLRTVSLQNYAPCIKNDYSKYYTSKFPDTFKCGSINEMIDKYFSYHQNKYIIEQLKSKINKYAAANLQKLNTLKSKQLQQMKKLEEAAEYKKRADIISANIYNLKQGIKSAKLYDFEGNETEIELDENKSPAQNAAKYYNLYKKAQAAYEHALSMIKETNSEILYFEELKYSAGNTDNIDDLKSLGIIPLCISQKNECHSELVSGAGRQQMPYTLSPALSAGEGEQLKTICSQVQNDLPDEQKGIISLNIQTFEIEGFKIYAGKNKKQNDYILSKLSSPDDLWFHPLNAAGAHILVKTEKKEPPDSVILKAAEITKEYSAQKNNSKTSIIYTKRRYVKKAAKKQAFVTYKNETEIII